MTFDIGPFRLYRVEDSETLCVSLIKYDGYSFGWEYGWAVNSSRKPNIELRIGKLQVFYFEKFGHNFEIWFMGLWWII